VYVSQLCSYNYKLEPKMMDYASIRLKCDSSNILGPSPTAIDLEHA